MEALVEMGFADSKSEGRRLIDQKGIRVNDDPVESAEWEVKSGDIIARGKLKMAKIIVQ